jgi:hypothetical protein
MDFNADELAAHIFSDENPVNIVGRYRLTMKSLLVDARTLSPENVELQALVFERLRAALDSEEYKAFSKAQLASWANKG